MTRSTTDPLDAAARDELARLLDAYVDAVRHNARIEGIESVGSWHDYRRTSEDGPRSLLFGELLALLASVRGAEADTRDAERYRFLREYACTIHVVDDECGSVIVQSMNDFAVSGYGESFDEAIDAARAHPPTKETDADAR